MVLSDSLAGCGSGQGGSSGAAGATTTTTTTAIGDDATSTVAIINQSGSSMDKKQRPPIHSISFDCEPYNSSSKEEQQDAVDRKRKEPEEPLRIEPTRKRYLILSMFVVLHMIKSFQWICLASITNVVARFYRVDNLAINWTTILFMVTFLVSALPVSWLMEKIGLRRAVLIGTSGVTCGVIIKCFSCHQDAFLYCMLGHLIVGLAEPFFFSSYSQVASVWFPDDQVAMATSWSVIGGQIGLALGFIIPPLMIGSDPDDELAIQQGLFRLFLAVALVSTLNTLSIVIFFDEKPQFAPGVARFKQIIQEEKRRRSSQASSEQMQRKFAAAAAAAATMTTTAPLPTSAGFKNAGRQSTSGASQSRRESRGEAIVMRAIEVRQSVGQQIRLSRDILFNRHFILLLIGFGINVGTVYSIHTLLNQMITRALPNSGPSNDPIQVVETVYSRNYSGIPELATLDIDSSQSSFATPPTTLVAPQSSQNVAQKWVGDDTNLVVGNTGLISILAGLLGSALCGYALDRFHRYKLTMSTIYLLTLISMVALTACVRLANPLAFYLVAIPLGFAFTGYEGCGFDYGVEITYPNPELLSSTLLNISAQICGVPISLVGSLIVDTYGSEALGLFFCAILTVGFLITCLQGGQLKRQDAVRERTGEAVHSANYD